MSFRKVYSQSFPHIQKGDYSAIHYLYPGFEFWVMGLEGNMKAHPHRFQV